MQALFKYFEEREKVGITEAQEQEAMRWRELEIQFLNEWMNRRLWKRWEAYLQSVENV
jgi:hypothetical protein